mgnify:CR=1 FL=1
MTSFLNTTDATTAVLRHCYCREKVDETFGGTEPVRVSRVCPGSHRFTGSVSVSANMTWYTISF